MAEETLNENLNVIIDVSGADSAAASLDGVVGRVEKLTGSTKKLDTVQTRSSQNYLKSLKDVDKQYSKMQSEFERSVRGLRKGWSDLTGELRTFKSSLIKVVGLLTGGAGIAGAIKFTREYGNTLLGISATTRRLGMDIQELEDGFESMGRTLALTREELSDMFKAYRDAMPLETMKGFKAVLESIQNITGSNSNEMKEYLNVVSGVVSKFPDLQAAIEGAGKAGSEYLSVLVQLLYNTQQITKAEYTRLRSMLQGTRALTTEELKEINIKKKNQAATQEIKKLYEDIKLIIGKELLPYVRQFAEWLQKPSTRKALHDMMEAFKWISDKVREFIRSIGGIGVAIKGVAIAFAAIKITKLVRGFASMASNASKMASSLKGSRMMGARGGLGGTMGKVGRFAGRAALGGIGFMAGRETHRYGEQMMADGNRWGGAALSTAGRVAQGASVGMIFGPLGAAVGGLAGALYDAAEKIKRWFNWGGEGKGLSKEERERDERRFFSQTAIADAMKTKLEVARNMGRSKATDPNVIAQRYGAIGEDSYTQRIGESLQSKQSELASIRKRTSPIRENMRQWEATAARMKEKLEAKIAGGASKIEIESYQTAIVAAERQVTLQREKNKDILDKEAKLQQDVNKINEGINAAMAIRAKRIENIMAYTDSINNAMKSRLYIMQQQGAVDSAQLQTYQKQFDEQSLASEAEIRSNLSVLRSKEQQLMKMKQTKQTTQALLAIRANIFNLESQMNQELQKRVDMSLQLTHAYDEQIQTAKMQAQYYSELVSLADSFGMGLGASVEARARVVQMLEQEKALVRENLKDAIEQWNSGKQTEDIRQRILELRQEELSVTKQQADMTKQMREGWVSAIQAMTTGTGRFTKIAMDANKNMTTQLGVLSVVEHAMSGSTRTGYRMGGGPGGGAMRWGVGGIGSTTGQVNRGMAYLNRMGSTDPASLAREIDSYVGQGVNRMKQGGQYFAPTSSELRKGAILQQGMPNIMKKATVSPSDLKVNTSGALSNSMRNVGDMIQSSNQIKTSGKGGGNTYININVNSSEPASVAREIVKKVGKYISRGGDVITNGFTK